MLQPAAVFSEEFWNFKKPTKRLSPEKNIFKLVTKGMSASVPAHVLPMQIPRCCHGIFSAYRNMRAIRKPTRKTDKPTKAKKTWP